MAEDYLVIDGLSKSFAQRGEPVLNVIKSLSVSVEEGALLSILGPSGCGKSTLLNIINGLDDATSGEVRIRGKKVTSGTRSSVRIGVIFQQPNLLNWRTVEDNVRMPLDELGVPRNEARERVRRYLDLVGLADFARFYPLQLSGGMQQRVSLARGLAIEPDLLLADEPFSALDEFSARKLRSEFVRIWQATGRTILFVTHNIREAVFLSTRMLMVTARPCTAYLDRQLDMSHPRSPEDDSLFEIEKEMTVNFVEMERERSLAAGT